MSTVSKCRNMVVTPHLHESPSPPPASLPTAAVFPLCSSLRHANQRPRPTRWSSPQSLALHHCWVWLTVTPDLRRYTASPTHANSAGPLQQALEKRRGSDGGKEEREGEMTWLYASWGWCEQEEREAPKGSVSILVSEVERSGGRQWQPPGKAPVYSPALRP